jgi:hypothetical protein
MAGKALAWWREHREELMGSLESVLAIAEKALVVLPPAQAMVGTGAAGLKVIRVSHRQCSAGALSLIARRADDERE